MSIPLIAAAMERKSAAIASPLATAYENEDFTPTDGVPYQRENLLPNVPIDHAVTADLVEWQGLFQIMLCYPLGEGRGAAQTRAQAIADHFAPAQTLIEGAIKVYLNNTPRIGAGLIDEGRWCIPVTISWSAFKT